MQFQKKLGFKLYNVINTKEQTIKNSITFEGENIETQYSALGYRIDFHEYKLAIEVDESGHTNRNINNEIERQKSLEKELIIIVYLLELILMKKILTFLNK